MHEIITSIGPYMRQARELADIRERGRKHRQRSIAASEEYQRKLREYAPQRREALLAGQEPPEEPKAPTARQEDALVFVEAERRVEAQMARALADHIDAIEQKAAEREAELLDEASGHAEALGIIGTELKELSSGVRLARSAAGLREPVGSGRLDAAGVARLLASGGSVLEPDPRGEGAIYSAAVPEPPKRKQDEDREGEEDDGPRRGIRGVRGFHRR